MTILRTLQHCPLPKEWTKTNFNNTRNGSDCKETSVRKTSVRHMNWTLHWMQHKLKNEPKAKDIEVPKKGNIVKMLKKMNFYSLRFSKSDELPNLCFLWWENSRIAAACDVRCQMGRSIAKLLFGGIRWFYCAIWRS